jgi:hypothetical protein
MDQSRRRFNMMALAGALGTVAGGARKPLPTFEPGIKISVQVPGEPGD